MAVATSRDVWESMRLAVDDRRARDNRVRLLIRRSRVYATAALICVALGLILIGMPRIQQLIGDRETDAQARSVSQSASLFPEGSRQSAIKSAIEYNQRLYESGQPQIGEPVFDGKVKGNFEGDDEYRRQLSVNGLDAMGELLIPKISVDLPIMHGASQDVLEHAAGHLAGTSLPVGGKNTRAVITGHSNLKGATLFTDSGNSMRGTRSISRSWATRSPTGSPANASSHPRKPRHCASIKARTRSRSSLAPVRETLCVFWSRGSVTACPTRLLCRGMSRVI